VLHRLRGITRGTDQQVVFHNRHGQPMTRDGIAYVQTKRAAAAPGVNWALWRKRITPHGVSLSVR
jgi:hypothetical protein